MPIEYSGFESQHVTTWGRHVVGDLYVGESTPLHTTTACRCGVTHRQPGFINAHALFKAGWQMNRGTGEVFCSIPCYMKYAPEAVAAERRELSVSKERLDSRLAALSGEV